MVKIIPYLLVPNGLKAIEFYKTLFNLDIIEHQPFSKEIGKEFGFPSDFNYEKSTMHAHLNLYGNKLYLADNTREESATTSNVEITIELDTKKQIEEIYNKAQKLGCKIGMELQHMFWGAWYTRFKDPNGIGWQLNFTEHLKKSVHKSAHK